MKIGIITDSIDYNAQGIGRVIKDFCYHLSETQFAKDNEIVLIHEKSNNNKIYTLANINELIVASYQVPFGREIRKIITLPNKIRRGDYDVIHDLANVGPFTNKINARAIQTVYDLTPVLFPTYHPYASVYRSKLGMKLIKNNVDHYITISRATANDLISMYKINSNKITTIYPALSPKITKLIDNQKNSKNPINCDYILFVGTIEPRKNISGLLEIFQKIKNKNNSIKLVIVGGLGWKYKNDLVILNYHIKEGNVVWFQDASDKKLAQLYNHAKLFIYPTFYEGFGLPVLEAIYAGLPVLASNISSLPEIIEDNNLLISLEDGDEFVNKSLEIIGSNSLTNKIVIKLKKRLKLFSWENNIKQTSEIYQKYA
ncbi:MAG: glycosyltransferase family 1 protein [bacterium]|nr:glycosyltransferase family 1 protein [bacterium]